MKKKSLVCLAFLCFLMSLMGVGCSATRESTDSSVSKAHEDTQITEHTGHGSESSTKAETVCLLSKLQSKEHIEIEVKMDELDLTSAESKATYEEIREYVFEHTGLKVSHLYIAQVKQKYGIIERENYNKPKSENAKQPQCPPEKEKAITEALKHFGMI